MQCLNAALEVVYVDVDEYLAGEERSDTRHEYICGVVHAMEGGTDSHNLISVNLVAALHSNLRGGSCRLFMADMVVRLLLAKKDVFYYPDVMVVCDSRDSEPRFKRYPKLIVEVLSNTTERIDRGEKLLSYTQIESLEEYVLAAQDRMEVTIFRRANGWKPEISGRNQQDEIEFRLVGLRMRLAEVYEGVRLEAGRTKRD